MDPAKRKLVLCGPAVVLFFLQGVLMQKISIGYIGTNTTIDCPLQGDFMFPSWQGPPFSNGIATEYYNPVGGQFNPVLKNRYSWAANSRSLILNGTENMDNGGVYTCSVKIGSSLQVANNTLNVRIRPSAPKITTSAPADGNCTRATEGEILTVTCTSRDGYPSPTVALYLESITGQKLAETNSGTSTGVTFTVELRHAFVPTRQNDRQQLVCRSYYPTPADAQQDSQQTQAKLFLYLKPIKPRVAQLTDVEAGGEVAVECRTTESRPAADIVWTYLSQTYTPVVSTTLDNTTQTFTTVSVLKKSVTQADNGQTFECRITHQFFNATLIKTMTLNVTFAVNSSSTSIQGNKLFTATGLNPLELTCTTGSSNPASSIEWRKDNTVFSSNSSYTDKLGQYNGIVRSQVLTLYPNRTDDGALIFCFVANEVTQMKDSASVTLNLRYRPIVTIQANPHLTIVEQTHVQPKQLPCSVDSKPLSNVTWHHNGHVVKQTAGVSSLSYTISNGSRTSYGSYTCSANNGVTPSDNKTYTVEVQFPPLGVTIQKQESVIANGRNNMSISCLTDSSNPVAMSTWLTGNIQTSELIHTEGPGQYGGKVLNSTVTFTPTRDHDGAVVYCVANNTVFHNKEVSNSTIIDNIKYSPLINVDLDKTVTEGDKVVLKCNASSKPTASFRWLKGTLTLDSRNGTASYNGFDYTLANVSRNQNGTYTCFADNKIAPDDSNHTRLVVQYPPDVAVLVVNETVFKQFTTVTCEAVGIPDRYTYKGWLHTWNGHTVLHEEPLPVTRVLNLTGLSYAHSGVYSCGVSNGVKGVVSHGEGSLLVKSFPVMIGKLATSKVIRTTGQLTKPAEVIFQYYSNAGIGSVKVVKTNSSGEEVGEIHQRSVDIILPVFQSEIMTLGTEVIINIIVVEESQFGDYQIIVTNEIDHVNLSLIILPLGPPETPVFVNSTVLDHQSVEIIWISGFPNGLNQTFVIQISTDNSTWRNRTQYGGMSFQQTHKQRVDNLASSQVYFVRILAVNSEGGSQSTTTFSFRTLARPDSNSSSNIGLIAGGAAGGTVAAVVIVAVIIFIVRRRKDMSPSGERKDKGGLVLTRNSSHNDGYDDGDEEVKNWLYEPAGPPQAETAVDASTSKQVTSAYAGDIYSKVTKKAEAIYAMPNKQKGDVYENAPNPINSNTSTSQSGDSVYEDTSITVTALQKKPAGSDGLVYADLTFGPKKKGPAKIIGIEDRCEYTTIDLTKKARTLPDSDEEEKTKQ